MSDSEELRDREEKRIGSIGRVYLRRLDEDGKPTGPEIELDAFVEDGREGEWLQVGIEVKNPWWVEPDVERDDVLDRGWWDSWVENNRVMNFGNYGQTLEVEFKMDQEHAARMWRLLGGDLRDQPGIARQGELDLGL